MNSAMNKISSSLDPSASLSIPNPLSLEKDNLAEMTNADEL